MRRRTEERQALAPLDLEVAPGEFVGLLGPNGAGKTTLVKLCCGLIRPTTGSVSVLGYEPARRRAEFLQSIAVVFGQKSMLWWDVPTIDSMLVHRAMYALDSPTFRRRVGDLTEVLDLSGVIDVPVRRLSLGERMRCELALSLLHSPRLLFADEPTIGLDVTAKQALRAMLARTNETLGTTIVLTSHDMDDVEALCRRILLVADGHLTSIFHGVGRSARSASLPIFADSFWHEGVTVRRVSVAVVGRPGPWVLQRVRSVTGPWAIQRGRATGRGGRGRPGRSEPRSTAPRSAGPAVEHGAR
ncbi:ATP-binding cassette domain-containing protein [Brachybacterium sp. JB7]|uniref:ABC transporter ATP-binding protein n=1 Tax=Brachybacterium sp. JB7 TaxID=2024478 RepID=UPI0018F696C4|nr:ATP-binding cassette domain-containing protein [Brachybacterium sp. JB7]